MDDLYTSLHAYLKYRQVKQHLETKHQDTSSELVAAYQAFLNTLPLETDPHQLVHDWDRAFHEFETDFTHQGG